jgi:hypothetical protein
LSTEAGSSYVGNLTQNYSVASNVALASLYFVSPVTLTDLTANVVAGHRYSYSITLNITADATSGFWYGGNGGTTSFGGNSMFVGHLIDEVTGTPLANYAQIGGSGASSANGNGHTSWALIINGMLDCGTTGTFIPKAAINAGSGTSYVLAGSTLTITQLN